VVMAPIAALEGWSAARAAAAAEPPVPALVPASGQPHPTSLWNSAPIPAVAAAVVAVRHRAPLPKRIIPTAQGLAELNATGGGIIPPGCEPTFGSGVTGKVCRLGDTSAKRVVVVIGDSQAGAWTPAVVGVAQAQHFAVVTFDKPGCFIDRVYTNLPGWPCASWYQWALAQDKALHPVATIVMFLLAAAQEDRRASTVSYFRSVLSQVTNGVYLANQPGQDQEPWNCLYKANANMRKCSARLPSTYVPLMQAMARMTTETHHPAIPTLQWFCADGICPMVINHTLITRDIDHITKQYSAELAPLLGLELKPILARLRR
jgi:SGNH domain (fused to AT3 domains)